MPPSRAELVDQLMRIVEIRLLDPLEILLSDRGQGDSRDGGHSNGDGQSGSGGQSGDNQRGDNQRGDNHSGGGDSVVGALRTLLRRRVATWALQMTGGDDRAAVGAVMRVMATLYPGDGPFEPPVDWWSSPLGQVLAYRVGHPTAESVPYPVAGAMLGITRQGVHDLVTRGKLARHPQGGVVPASVRARLAQEGFR